MNTQWRSKRAYVYYDKSINFPNYHLRIFLSSKNLLFSFRLSHTSISLSEFFQTLNILSKKKKK